LAGREKTKRESEQIEAARQCPACFAVHAPAAHCPECGHTYTTASREIEHVAGDLTDVTDALAVRWGKHRPLRDVLREARDEDLPAIAKARGYKPGWVRHLRQFRAQRATRAYA
jgi:hypothetical protein